MMWENKSPPNPKRELRNRFLQDGQITYAQERSMLDSNDITRCNFKMSNLKFQQSGPCIRVLFRVNLLPPTT
jgi:hypothetical protein